MEEVTLGLLIPGLTHSHHLPKLWLWAGFLVWEGGWKQNFPECDVGTAVRSNRKAAEPEVPVNLGSFSTAGQHGKNF